MATLYTPGTGADQSAAYNTNAYVDAQSQYDDELKKKTAAQTQGLAGPQQPQQPQVAGGGARSNVSTVAGGGASPQAQQTGSQQPQQPQQPTFAEMQAAGQARPNPPAAAQPQPQGQQTAAAYPANVPTPGVTSSGLDPWAAILQQQPVFTGDLGVYYGQQINAQQQALQKLPTYNQSADYQAQIQQLMGNPVPTIPAPYTPDERLRAGVPGMPTSGPGAINTLTAPANIPQGNVPQGNVPQGQVPTMPDPVSSNGLDPVAAAQQSVNGPVASPAVVGAGGVVSSGSSTSTGTKTTDFQNPNIKAATDQAILDMLANPSAFDNEAVMDLYGRMGADIDDRFSMQDTALREEMARRGLSDSSIQGGRLADLNVSRRSAMEDLAKDLGIQRAQDFAQARNAAVTQGLNSRAQTETETSSARNAALQGQSLAQQAQDQAFKNNLANLIFQSDQGQRGFDNSITAAELGLKAQGQSFDQGIKGITTQSDLDQRAFDNNLKTSELNRLYGQDAMDWSKLYQTYGQQAFDNDITTQQENRAQQEADTALLLKMLGLQ